MTIERNASADFDKRIDAPYWRGLADGILRLPQCAGCDRWIWPVEWRCGTCGSYEIGWKEREPLGTVYSHAVTHQAFVSSFADLVPYAQVLVELPHCDGRRLFGLLDGPSDGLAIGRAVEGIILAPTDRTLGLASLVWRLI